MLSSSRVPRVCPGRGGWFWMKLIPALPIKFFQFKMCQLAIQMARKIKVGTVGLRYANILDRQLGISLQIDTNITHETRTCD